MSYLRWPAVVAIGVISGLLAYFLRDVVYELIIVPIAYFLWVLKLYYSAIPQWILWALLVALLCLTVLWDFLPEIRFPERQGPRLRRPEGEVEALAIWVRKSRQGNYFKWQLANRFGRIARRLDDVSGPGGRQPSTDDAVEKYLDAGLNYSFVDFPGPRSWFERPPRTPLDLDPGRVADYLESQMEQKSGRSG